MYAWAQFQHAFYIDHAPPYLYSAFNKPYTTGLMDYSHARNA